jgi:hypothetical protein
MKPYIFDKEEGVLPRCGLMNRGPLLKILKNNDTKLITSVESFTVQAQNIS